jgi:hypothetical protein
MNAFTPDQFEAFAAKALAEKPTAPKARKVARVAHTCAECGSAFEGARTASFCGVRCKDSWHNRSAKRGRVAMPLALAMVAGRRGSSEAASYARREFYALCDQWIAEDKAAGRMTAAEYLAPKMEAGWRACDL